MGMISVLFALVGFSVSIILKALGVYDFVETPILLASSVLLMGGVNIVGIGLIAEILARGFVSDGGVPLPHSVARALEITPRKT